MTTFSLAGACHPGHDRLTNEDHVLVDAEIGLVAVADGIGGEHGGEVAAQAGCLAIADVVRAAPGNAPTLRTAFDNASTRVIALAKSDLEGMGATIAAVRLMANEALMEVGHLGDVRVYVLRKTTTTTVPCAAPLYCPPVTLPSGTVMICVTRDHSSVCELVERGHLERAAAARHPLRSRISRALGRSESRPDVQIIPLLAGDRILVCTDGLWSLVADDVIAKIVDEALEPQAACDGLINAALSAGGNDNIGVALVHWIDATPPQRPREPDVARPVEPSRGEPSSALGGLLEYGRDLTAVARRGELDPVIGRGREVKELARALVQRRKSNALLIGEPGVGKTSVVEALAQRIVAGDGGDSIAGLRIIELSISNLIAGTKYRGELEERVSKVIEAAEQEPDIVLFIDEIHSIAPGNNESSAAMVAGALKPALARGRVRVIGATTNAEYERYLSRDEAFTRRFELIQIAEPSAAETRTMLVGLRARIETHYRARIDDTALDAAIDLAVRYMPDRRLPDKAVDLIDRACARRMLETLSRRDAPLATPISRREIALAVADRCRLPIELVERDASELLAAVDAGLRERVRGQDTAIDTIRATLQRAHSPLRDPKRPVASFVFAGPTGVGKTAAARAVAELLFGHDALVKLDMSEYGEGHTVSRLIGAPPGYVGHGDEGQLTGPVRRRPACMILLDEIEKAHPDVLLLMLQVLDEGALTDGRGRTTSFREAIVIMTTNLPLAETRARKIAGFGPGAESEPDRRNVDAAHRQALAKHLRPELVGRIDVIVPFRALERSDHVAIVDVVAARLEARLRAQGVTPPPGEETRRRVLERLDSLGFGVRQVERITEQVIGEALETSAKPDAIVMDSIRTRVSVAMLLVDIVGSTRMLADVGETRYVGAVRQLVEAVRCHSTAPDLQFLKCTGDGVLALYGSVDAALDAACDLIGVGDEPHRAQLRRVVHHGRVRHAAGDFLGVEMHRVFRIEAIGPADRVGDGPELARAPLLVSTAARDRLDEVRRRLLTRAGDYRLSGFAEPVELWVYTGGKPS